ncbi:MFS transporter [Streptomyces sp. ST2-7A]|uniref:MDR family MFS transporter n=1 Tax=Streptomyces sp. ST2-7A TaxID=2907214 RepID=UPI001F1A8171|nr:MFS transporter [Streptomyces sp. ST2-7A]MCE7079527.1 MFS transporter [Streptomyces sp. ST2-7A]
MVLRQLHPNIRLRIGIGFVQRLLGIMLMPLMTIRFAELYGAVTAGLLVLVVAVCGILANLLGGHLADLYGRKPLMVGGELGATITFAGLALAASPWWDNGIAIYLFFLLNIILSQSATPASEAMIVDVSTPENRTLVYTINYWATNLAFTIGALLGGFLYRDFFPHLLGGAAVLSLLTTVVTVWLITESAPLSGPRVETGVRALVNGYRVVVRDRVFHKIFYAAVLITMVEMQIGYYIAVRLAEDFPEQSLFSGGGWELTVDGVSMLGILRAVNAALVVLLILVSGKLLGRLSERLRLHAGLAMFTLGYMVWAVSNDGRVLLLAAVVLTVGEIASVPVRQTLLANHIPPASRTRYMAVYTFNARAGLVIASLCVTLGALLPPAAMSVLFGICGALAALLYHLVLRHTARAPERTQAENSPVTDERIDS